MSKFAKPLDPAALAQLAKGADVHDNDAQAGDGVRFSLILVGPLVSRVDRACKAKGGMSRAAWIRAAIADALDAQGF